MAATVVKHAYVPRRYFTDFHARSQRWAVMVVHRRGGKTVAVVNDMVARALRTRKPDALYGYIAPTYGMAKDIAWLYIKKAVQGIPGVVVRESETQVTLPNGARIRCFGVDNPDTLRGKYFDGVVCDEFGEWEGRAYTEVIRPALSDRKGWAVFIGTPKGKNKFWELCEHARANPSAWYFVLLTHKDTNILPQEEIDDARELMEESEFAQEYLCSFEAALRGSYYSSHIDRLAANGRILFGADGTKLFAPQLPVHISHDPGRDDSWAIWFWQIVNGNVHYIDYWEETGWDADEVIEMLAMRPYTWGTWWVPHDALHKTARSKKSILDVMRAANAPARKVPNPDGDFDQRLLNGINATRKVLRTYPVWFDGDRCKRGLESLRNYSRKWNADSKVYATKPKHDQWSNGADSFRYSCLAIDPTDLQRSLEQTTSVSPPRSIVVGSVNTSSRYTLNDAFADRARQQRAQGDRFRMRIG
jgi:hypothetical protein